MFDAPRVIRGYVSQETLEYEREEAAIFWHKPSQWGWDSEPMVKAHRSAFVVDTAQWERIRETLGPTKPTGCTPAQAAEWKRLMESGYGVSTPEHADARDIQERLLPHRRKARNDFKVGAGLQPFPVYVATMADGTETRLSFWSRAGKPVDFADGFNAAMVIGRNVPVAGYVEHNGQRLVDPHFTPELAQAKTRKESAASRLAAIVKALKEGEIEAAIRMAEAA